MTGRKQLHCAQEAPRECVLGGLLYSIACVRLDVRLQMLKGGQKTHLCFLFFFHTCVHKWVSGAC